jgi:hypothetical protein
MQGDFSMKSRVMIWAVLLAIFALPAMADTITFTNVGGNVSGGFGGLKGASTINSVTINGMLIGTGDFGPLSFTTGMLTGSLSKGASFSTGVFEFTVGSLIKVTNFMGTVTKIGNDLFDLAGTFSGTSQGVHFTGSTNQTFSFNFDDDHHGRQCFNDLQGTTTLIATTASVPEPGTLMLFGTGLMALAGVVRRRVQLGQKV